MLRSATIQDALYLSSRLKQADVDEIKALGSNPTTVLFEGLSVSKPLVWTFTNKKTNTPIAIGGIRPLQGTPYGIVWILSTDDIQHHALTLQRTSKLLLELVFQHTKFAALCNVVSAKNTTAINWLKRLGFIFVHINIPLGKHGEQFHSFAITKESTVCANQSVLWLQH